MNTVTVKICGIRRVDSAFAAVTAGADFLGFNFIPTSKRYIDPKRAQQIIKLVRERVRIVGVFKDQDISYVNNTTKLLKFDYVQLHGNETPEFVEKAHAKVIKAFTATTINKFPAYDIAYALIDRKIQGQGEIVPEEVFKNIPSQALFIAGGLTAQNVGSVLKNIQPFGVDVAGGIETNGVEDSRKIHDFIRIVKGGSL